MRKVLAALLSTTLLASCDLNASSGKNPQQAGASPDSVFTLVEVSEKVEDPASPFGYWEVTKSFPKLSDSQSSAQAVNGAIEQIVSKYSCDSPGDEAFNSEVSYSSGELLSFHYEAMWMCQSMPSPDSTTGAATFDLKTGQLINIDSEFSSPDKKKAAYTLLREALDKKVSQIEQDNGMTCNNRSSLDGYYVTDSEIVFLHDASTHDESVCGTEVALKKSDAGKYLRGDSLLLK